jgi:hypothetical protein
MLEARGSKLDIRGVEDQASCILNPVSSIYNEHRYLPAGRQASIDNVKRVYNNLYQEEENHD